VRLDLPTAAAGASPSGLHLTYCTNIHPGDGWSAVEANIQRFAPRLKAQLSPSQPFGLGLRLSAREARELRAGTALAAFRAWLDDHGLYVALINGFPYGPFHGTPVKAEVYAPDWRTAERVDYTLDLIHILERLLPEGLNGGVSTAPLTYKAWLRDGDSGALATMATNVARVAVALRQARDDRGVHLHLDIEPEPDCLLETSAETIAFFERSLLPAGGAYVRHALGLSPAESEAALLEHVQVCFDCCHFAVEYEDPAVALQRLAAAGLRVGRVQLSSAIDVAVPSTEAPHVVERLRPFADSTYLHQVIERQGGHLRHYPDLGDALDAPAGGDRQWRIHFHVPLFAAEYDGLGSTQGYVTRVLELALRAPFTTHLEIETYTWDVLPGGLKLDLGESIRREYDWVLSAIAATAPPR